MIEIRNEGLTGTNHGTIDSRNVFPLNAKHIDAAVILLAIHGTGGADQATGPVIRHALGHEQEDFGGLRMPQGRLALEQQLEILLGSDRITVNRHGGRISAAAGVANGLQFFRIKLDSFHLDFSFIVISAGMFAFFLYFNKY